MLRLAIPAVALAALLAAPLAAADWPLFLGNPDRNAVSPTPLDPPLETAWTYEAPGGVDSTAIIVDGVVYFGEMDGRFHAVDLETGEARWVYQANLGVPASGCVSGGAVFFGDEDGYFHAVDIETGKKRWVFEGFAEFLSSPICLDDAVLVGSYDANLYAFDPASGAVKWKYATDDRVNSSPAVVAGKTFITGCDGKFRVIDVASGEEDSFVDMQDYVAASPSVVGNLAYVGTFGNEVLAMDWKKGEILWRYHHPQTQFEFFASPVVRDGLVVIGGRDKKVHAIDQRTASSYGSSPPAPASIPRPSWPETSSGSARWTATSTPSITPTARCYGNSRSEAASSPRPRSRATGWSSARAAARCSVSGNKRGRLRLGRGRAGRFFFFLEWRQPQIRGSMASIGGPLPSLTFTALRCCFFSSLSRRLFTRANSF